jgi:hypothetical protein
MKYSDDKIILIFIEKSGNRFMKRIKIDNIISEYFLKMILPFYFQQKKNYT